MGWHTWLHFDHHLPKLKSVCVCDHTQTFCIYRFPWRKKHCLCSSVIHAAYLKNQEASAAVSSATPWVKPACLWNLGTEPQGEKSYIILMSFLWAVIYLWWLVFLQFIFLPRKMNIRVFILHTKDCIFILNSCQLHPCPLPSIIICVKKGEETAVQKKRVSSLLPCKTLVITPTHQNMTY